MHEMLLVGKKKANDPNTPIMAMDFEGGSFQDLVKTRTFGVVGNPQISQVKFINGTSSLYSPNGSVLSTPRTEDLTFPGDFWIEMWGNCLGPNPSATSGDLNVLLGFGSYPNAPGLLRFGLSTIYPTIRVPSGAADTPLITGAFGINYTDWYHYGLGRKDNMVYLFLNGQLQGSAAYAGNFGFGDRMSIGAYEDSRINGSTYAGWNGYIDRLRIYDKCLYTGTFEPLTSPY